MHSPDQVCANAASQGIKMTIVQKDDFVLIEGNQEALMFLSQLFAAQSRATKGAGFQISPHCAGNALFSSDSDMGLYIHLVE